jgi:hypothetical protein
MNLTTDEANKLIEAGDAMRDELSRLRDSRTVGMTVWDAAKSAAAVAKHDGIDPVSVALAKNAKAIAATYGNSITAAPIAALTDEQLYAQAMAEVTPEALDRMDRKMQAMDAAPVDAPKVLTDDEVVRLAEQTSQDIGTQAAIVGVLKYARDNGYFTRHFAKQVLAVRASPLLEVQILITRK